MRKLLGVAFIFCLLGLSLSANIHYSSDIYEYDYSDTLDFDTLDIVEEVLVDTSNVVAIDINGIIGNEVMDFYDIDSLSALGESSAELYAGRQFKVKNNDGSEFEYKVNDDGVSVTVLRGVANGTKKLVIPSSVEGLDSYFFVTGIADYAFISHAAFTSKAMDGVEELVISEGIITVGESCFQYAQDLEYVSLPTTLTNISGQMFACSPKLRKIIIPENSELTEIGWYAFWDCPKLDSFYIPSSVSKIGYNPWRECPSLERVNLSESNYNFVEEDGVLYSDWQGELIQYPTGKKDKIYHPLFGTKTIGNAAFYGNPYIEKVILPASIDSISHLAFCDCASLEDVLFNGEIQFIGNGAFTACPKLESLTVYGNPSYSIGVETYLPIESFKKISVTKDLPQVNLPKSSSGILSSVWDYVAQMPYFYNEEMKNNEDFGFPKYLGKGKAAVSGNAGPKPDVLHVLDAIPSNYLVLDNNDERNRTTRFYLDKSNKKIPRALYFFGGTGGNDLVVVLFEGGNLKQIEKMINEAETKGIYKK